MMNLKTIFFTLIFSMNCASAEFLTSEMAPKILIDEIIYTLDDECNVPLTPRDLSKIELYKTLQTSQSPQTGGIISEAVYQLFFNSQDIGIAIQHKDVSDDIDNYTHWTFSILCPTDFY